MAIEGPLQISIVDKDDSIGRELHLQFTSAFQQLSNPDRISDFSRYISRLRQDSANMSFDEADRQGMLMIIQIAEQLLPHIETDEIPLSEKIVIEIKPDSVLGSFIISETRQ